jgi:hypothetical protein
LAFWRLKRVSTPSAPAPAVPGTMLETMFTRSFGSRVQAQRTRGALRRRREETVNALMKR